MFFNRLRRFVTATLLLVLPLQGQAIASMSCHAVQGALTVMASPAPAPAHSGTQASVLGEVGLLSHGSGHGHVHSHAASAVDSNRAVNSSSVGVDMSPQADNASAPTNSCVLCATCCMLSAALPPHAISRTDQFKTPVPGRLSSAMLAGVVPDGLLRPPR